MCGLKPKKFLADTFINESHPSWVCGLKRVGNLPPMEGTEVTPFVGVWIETRVQRFEALAGDRHTLRGCVD